MDTVVDKYASNDIYALGDLSASNFLVTGGAGFIGSNIVEKLLELGCSVRVLDNLSTGKIKNIERFFEYQNFEFIEGDIRDINICHGCCDGIDYVLHQAALGSVPRSIEDPATTNAVNISGTLNMLLAARENHVSRFIYASSSSVYGDSISLPKIEGITGNPASPYAITKKTCELYARNFYELYGLKTIGLRYFNVFGKRQDPFSQYAAVIPLFVNNIIYGRPSIIYGDGEQSRDFTYIGNVVQANLKVCLSGEEAYGEVFNIACGDRITINSLYRKLCSLLGREIDPEYAPPRPGDVRHSNADTGKAERLLKYKPEIGFEKGLELTVDWYLEACD